MLYSYRLEVFKVYSAASSGGTGMMQEGDEVKDASELTERKKTFWGVKEEV